MSKEDEAALREYMKEAAKLLAEEARAHFKHSESFLNKIPKDKPTRTPKKSK